MMNCPPRRIGLHPVARSNSVSPAAPICWLGCIRSWTASTNRSPEGTPSGVTVYAAVEKHSHHKTVADLLPQPEPRPPDRARAPKNTWPTG